MQDYFAIFADGLHKMQQQNGDVFRSMGMDLFRSFAVILIALFGFQSVLSAGEGRGFSWSRFISLLQELLIVYTMLTFYSTPIPGLGVSFTGLILDQATAMIAQLDQSRLQAILETLNTLESNVPYPSVYEILAILRFFVLLGSVLAAQAVTLYVVLFGYAATGVHILLGPVFIPFKVLPQMDWLFWGWFRSFIQFAFYQVVASAYVFVFGDFLMQFLGAKNIPMSDGEFAVLFVPLVLMLLTYTLGTIKVPALAFSIFSGRSGEYVLLRWR